MQTYKIEKQDFLIGDSERAYSINKRYIIHDMSPEDRPRERLIQEGPLALQTHELLAVVLGTGTKKEDVLSMSLRISKQIEYGNRVLFRHKSVRAFAEDFGIPLQKASQIVALSELGRRFFEKNEKGRVMIRTAKDVFDYVQHIRNLSKEHLYGLYLNTQQKVIHEEVLSIGTIDANIVHPREVFRPALEYSSAAIILVHNHPSGNTKASPADIRVTEQIVNAGRILGINLLDHVIVSKKGFSSVDVNYQLN